MENNIAEAARAHANNRQRNYVSSTWWNGLVWTLIRDAWLAGFRYAKSRESR